MNDDWRNAVKVLSEAAHELSTMREEIRAAFVMKAYGSRIYLCNLAKEYDYDADTVGRHYQRVQKWLMGVRKNGLTTVEGLDPTAWVAADSALRAAGIVGALDD